MHVLHTDSGAWTPGSEPSPEGLRELYAFPDGGCLRTNFVATLDGAATGADGRSGSINNAADKVVFDLNRDLCEAIVVGASTADEEGYRAHADGPPLVVLSNRGILPRRLVEDQVHSGAAIFVTSGSVPDATLDRARDALGHENVWVIGDDAELDLAAALDRVRATGRRRLLCEGGPRLQSALLAAGLVDELALTWVPSLVGGDGPRIAHGPAFDHRARLRHLLHADGTLLGLWHLHRESSAPA